ncbi:hypothetical protein ACFLZF_00125 [Nanoarchaeota archaeon]
MKDIIDKIKENGKKVIKVTKNVGKEAIKYGFTLGTAGVIGTMPIYTNGVINPGALLLGGITLDSEIQSANSKDANGDIQLVQKDNSTDIQQGYTPNNTCSNENLPMRIKINKHGAINSAKNVSSKDFGNYNIINSNKVIDFGKVKSNNLEQRYLKKESLLVLKDECLKNKFPLDTSAYPEYKDIDKNIFAFPKYEKPNNSNNSPVDPAAQSFLNKGCKHEGNLKSNIPVRVWNCNGSDSTTDIPSNYIDGIQNNSDSTDWIPENTNVAISYETSSNGSRHIITSVGYDAGDFEWGFSNKTSTNEFKTYLEETDSSNKTTPVDESTTTTPDGTGGYFIKTEINNQTTSTEEYTQIDKVKDSGYSTWFKWNPEFVKFNWGSVGLTGKLGFAKYDGHITTTEDKKGTTAVTLDYTDASGDTSHVTTETTEGSAETSRKTKEINGEIYTLSVCPSLEANLYNSDSLKLTGEVYVCHKIHSKTGDANQKTLENAIQDYNSFGLKLGATF